MVLLTSGSLSNLKEAEKEKMKRDRSARRGRGRQGGIYRKCSEGVRGEKVKTGTEGE